MTRHAPRQLVIAATVLVMMLALVAVPSSLRLTPKADAAAALAPGAITLAVQSARTVSTATPPTGGHFVHKGDAVTSYKWLVTADDAGNPNDDKTNCLPPPGRTPAAAGSTD